MEKAEQAKKEVIKVDYDEDYVGPAPKSAWRPANVRRSEELASWIAQQGKKSGRRVRTDHPKKKADN